ncbi:hypothetical protein FA95DRAFT_1564748 [Auriscalpium vulgare]|uniref:Uncharacterized protein n=1 Tax=Auriscalpium vulgare TaxID=40419 RepID=A0ACB8RDB3_9AGAM|nr:hypothetical protein FA95DRAFT_1564748 [Auriscalpium vulgare]
MALLQNTAAVAQAQPEVLQLADLQAAVPKLQASVATLQAAVAKLQGHFTRPAQVTTLAEYEDAALIENFATLTENVVTLTGKVNTFDEKVRALDEKVNTTDEMRSAFVAILELDQTLTLIAWNIGALEIREHNLRVHLDDAITPIPVHPDEPGWPDGTIYSATRRAIFTIDTHDEVTVLLKGYRLTTTGGIDDKIRRLSLFICGTSSAGP